MMLVYYFATFAIWRKSIYIIEPISRNIFTDLVIKK